MARLMRKMTNEILFSDLKIARTSVERNRGLLGHAPLQDSEAMLIERCRWIHTFFMPFAIDCVYVDRRLQVVSIVENMRPGRLGWPQWRARSVVEMAAGAARRLNFQVGEELHVGDSHTER